ncbi:MAG: CHASE3 domain-containing protein [Betaproteobacteria bacterium]|nr:CHASE3 domain-containing protein [Betaproteobacteria bacterium]
MSTVPKSLMIAIALAGLFTIGVITVSEVTYSNTITGLDRLRGERERIDLVDDFLEAMLNAETGQRGYLLTGRTDYLAPLEKARKQLPLIRSELETALIDRPDRREAAMRLYELCRQKITELDDSIRRFDQGERASPSEPMTSDESKRLMDQIRTGIEQLSSSMSQEFRENRQRVRDSMFMARMGLFVVASLNLLLLVAVVWLLVKNLAHKDQITRLIDSENVRLGHEVAERTRELNELSNHLQQSTEMDKAALARDLHDELGGILTSAKMDLDWMRSHTPASGETDARFEQLNHLLDDAVLLKRRVVENLRPSLLDNLGLVPAIEWHVTELCEKSGVACEMDLPEDLAGIQPDTAIALYRIVQEGLTNVLRHARARTFRLSLKRLPTGLRLAMADDGIGLPPTFNPSSLSHGLSGMRQRARALGGNVAWKPTPGGGTTVEIEIPRGAV